MIELFNLRMTYDGKDRLYFPSIISRDNEFSTGGTQLNVSNFERVDDLNFNVDVYTSIENLESFNYAIYKGYYCFIDSIIEKTETSCCIKLRLDVVTQYLNGDLLDTNKEIFIRRTHLDRFIEVGQDEYRYNFDDDDLLVLENINIEPTIYTGNDFSFTEKALTSLKWLAITKTADDADLLTRDSIQNRFRFQSATPITEIIGMPNTTYYVPLLRGHVQFQTEAGVPIADCYIDEVIRYASTSDVLDVKVAPYIPTKDIESIIDTGSSIWVRVLSDSEDKVVKFENTNLLTHMLTRNEYGEREELTPCTIDSDPYAHKPVFTLHEIVSNEMLEPKLYQFMQYEFNFLQNKFLAPFDQFKNEDMKVVLQAGLDYTTERNDFYLESGNFNNFKNSGAMIVSISDMTIAQNVDQWKEYITQKKTTSSASYAYGTQVISGLLGAGLQAGVGNVFGAVSGVAGTASNVAQTYAQRQDLKQAPAQIKARGSNVLSDFVYCDTFFLSASEKHPTETEKKFILNRLIYDGYLLNDYRYLSDIIDTRENFNYIETLNEDNILNIGVSTQVLNELNRLLNKGVRLYKSIDKLEAKTKINTERSL